MKHGLLLGLLLPSIYGIEYRPSLKAELNLPPMTVETEPEPGIKFGRLTLLPAYSGAWRGDMDYGADIGYERGRHKLCLTALESTVTYGNMFVEDQDTRVQRVTLAYSLKF